MKSAIRIFTIVLFTFLMACSTGDDGDPLEVFREIAYNSLTTSEKSSLLEDWRKAEVSAWTNGNYIVTFNTKDDAVLGPIQVVVDPVNGVVVEKLPRF
jgi:hypothetical protein